MQLNHKIVEFWGGFANSNSANYKIKEMLGEMADNSL